MKTADDVFATLIQELPKSERLKLASRILTELSETSAAALDFDDSWNDEDMRDIAAFSLSHAEELYPEEGSLV
jgi:hypothetical protein